VQFRMRVIDTAGRPTGAEMPPRGRELFRGDPLGQLLRCPDDIVWQPTSGNAFAAHAVAAVLPMPEEEYRICADYYLSNLTPLHGTVAVLDDVGGSYRVHGRNSHFAASESLHRLRENVRRTHVTHEQLIAHARRLGLTALGTDPDRVRSVSAAANRLISYRFAPAEHPIARDTRGRVLALGIRSALARTDVALFRRVVMAGWFVAAACAPRRVLPMVVKPFATIDVEPHSGELDEPADDQHEQGQAHSDG
jgi:hypothetical protein